MIGEVNDAGWGGSPQYQKLSDFEKGLLMDFLNETCLAAYRRWVESGKTMSVDEVVDTLNRLEIGGIKVFFKSKR